MRKYLKKLFGQIAQNHNRNVYILIECIAIIMIWRWVWDLLEIYVFPNSPLISNLICVMIWIIVLLLDDGKLWELEEEKHKTEKK